MDKTRGPKRADLIEAGGGDVLAMATKRGFEALDTSAVEAMVLAKKITSGRAGEVGDGGAFSSGEGVRRE